MTEFFAESVPPAGRAEPPAGSRSRAGRSRAAGLAAVAGLALLAAGAAGCSSGGSSGGSGGSAAAAAPPTGIQVPAKIGPLTKEADDKTGVSGTGIPKSVLKNLHTASYSVSGVGEVLINGGPGLPIPADGSPDKVKRLFSEWDVDAAGDPLTSVPSGSAGGSAECAPYVASAKDLECGWVSGKVALVLGFNGFTADKARALLPQILSAMVVTK